MRSTAPIWRTAAIAVLILSGCDSITTSMEESNPVPPSTAANIQYSIAAACQPTGFVENNVELTAKYVNQDVSGTVDIGSCDIGAYFTEAGAVTNASFMRDASNPRQRQYGVLVVGADVKVTDSEIALDGAFRHEFMAIAYRRGATGEVQGNTLTGPHRVGILATDGGTNVLIVGNDVTGTGPKASGWAENGIQISSGATANIKQNVVSNHFWNNNRWVSSGILVYGSNEVVVNQNRLVNNDAGLYIYGDRNNFIHNTIEYDLVGTAGLQWGTLLIGGSNNGLRQNTYAAVEGYVGLYNLGKNSKLIRNTFTGWTYPLYDAGEDTKLPKPFAPEI